VDRSLTVAGQDEGTIRIHPQEFIERACHITISQIRRRVRGFCVSGDSLEGRLAITRRKDPAASVEHTGLKPQHGIINTGANLSLGIVRSITYYRS